MPRSGSDGSGLSVTLGGMVGWSSPHTAVTGETPSRAKGSPIEPRLRRPQWSSVPAIDTLGVHCLAVAMIPRTLILMEGRRISPTAAPGSASRRSCDGGRPTSTRPAAQQMLPREPLGSQALRFYDRLARAPRSRRSSFLRPLHASAGGASRRTFPIAQIGLGE